MHGHQQWQSTEGRIVDVEPARGHHEHNFTIDVRKSDGALIRQTIKLRASVPYPVGTTIRLEISDRDEVRFDPNYPGDAAVISSMDMSDQIREASAAFDHAGSAGQASSGAIDFTDVLAAFGRNAGAAATYVMGPDGQMIPAGSDEITQLTQAMLSGDPDTRQAAVDRLHEIRANTQIPRAASTVPIEERLTRLQSLRDSGLLTESEYQDRRQKIIDET